MIHRVLFARWGAGALIAAVLIGGLPVAATAAPTSEGAQAAVEYTVEGEKYYLNKWDEVRFPKVFCPVAAPYLNKTRYNDKSGWRLPLGVEIRTGGKGIDANVDAIANDGGAWVGAGAGLSSAKNYGSKRNWVQVTLHCTASPS
ncbi:hypothetical protein [Microbacterium rhizomatis]|uniref:Uncharacterized protein n=1 Tax=Microbacterium rhizomatis TaxID=1631477 RepID=A0A5J5IZS1_9MICO|nr:hypothetical protein [Microbacterium rhizomatis]KAA9107745.1 hypothetical protein F6B43_09900 [Microbacterium rhizomatis]